MTDVRVLGVGMTRFAKGDRSLRAMADEAVTAALGDAGVDASRIDGVFVANAVGGLLTGQEMVRGQVVLSGLGFDGVPIFNVENACASASSAVHLACQGIASGEYDVALCVGVEKLTHDDAALSLESIGTAVDVERRVDLAARLGKPGDSKRSLFMDIYADLAKRYMAHSGATREHFAAVASKNQRNGALNPLAQYGGDISEEEVLATREIVWPLTLMMCSPISDGAAAVVLASPGAASRLGSRGSGGQSRIRASVVRSGVAVEAPEPLSRSLSWAARDAYEQAGVGPGAIDIAEVHDATAPAELMAYEDLGLASEGNGPKLLESGETRLGGTVPVNPSGGLLARGHPIGATGIAQICEAVWQLDQRAGARQVERASVALTQNSGGWVEGDYASVAVHILSV
jgi:acetyl-CoA acetyltransferase